MKVGGVGGADSQHVGFRATPGETVQVRSGRQQQELELALMRASQGRVGGSGPMNIKHTYDFNVQGTLSPEQTEAIVGAIEVGRAQTVRDVQELNSRGRLGYGRRRGSR